MAVYPKIEERTLYEPIIRYLRGIDRLYQKVGFVSLPRQFSWKNIHGEVKQDYGGMITPVCSQELFEHVLKGKDIFYVGKGYW